MLATKKQLLKNKFLQGKLMDTFSLATNYNTK